MSYGLAEFTRDLGLPVSQETAQRLETFRRLLAEWNKHTNLVGPKELDLFWSRHALESAQLLRIAPPEANRWIDLGSGAGFPGIVVALMMPELRMTLVESRRKRIDFLTFLADSLGIADRVTVAGRRLEMLETATYDVISARAFAPLDRLLPLAHRFSHRDTRWLLPKGRSAASELEAVRGSWQGVFRIEPSRTDSDAAIIVAAQVQPMGRAKGLR